MTNVATVALRSATGPKHFALVGLTASGKSALAVEIATVLGGIEIVSLDSMQVYRGMDIGTAKPTPVERRGIPHHLIDVADPWEEWSIARLQTQVGDVIAEIEARGHRALFVGGSGLHVQAVIDGLELPGEDRALRVGLEKVASEPEGLAELWAELERADPTAAARIEPLNARRIVRAVEVIRLTGQPFSSFGPGISHYGEPVISVRMAGISLPRDVLHRRIEERFAQMRTAGLVEEVRRLHDDPRGWSRTARQAIGYKEVLAHLEARGLEEAGLDNAGLANALARAVVRTRQFARRQRAWFRRDPRITWFEADENPDALLPALLGDWRG